MSSDPADPGDPGNRPNDSGPDSPDDEQPSSQPLGYEPANVERAASTAPTEEQLEHEMPGGRDVRHDPYAALRVPGYRFYALGSAISNIGLGMQGTVIGWEIYTWTGSYAALSTVALVQAIPMLLLTLPAGQLADMFNRRRILMLTVALSGLCAVALGVVSWMFGQGMLTLNQAQWGLYTLLAVGTTISVLGRPARQSMMPSIVPRRVFSNAVTWNSTIGQVSSMLGPALAGLIIIWNTAWVYFTTAACLASFVIFLGMLRLPPQQIARGAAGLAGLAEGVRFVGRQKVVLAALSLDLFAVLFGSVMILLPGIATDILGVGSVGFGWLRAAPAIGAFGMAIVLAHLPPMQHAGRMLLLAVVGFGVTIVIFGLSTWFWLSLAMLLLSGALDNVSVVVRHTLVQLLTPEHMRGRVSAVNAVFIGSSNDLGGVRAGKMAAWLGPVTSITIGGVMTIVTVGVVALLWPQVRRFGSLQDARPEGEAAPSAGGEPRSPVVAARRR